MEWHAAYRTVENSKALGKSLWTCATASIHCRNTGDWLDGWPAWNGVEVVGKEGTDRVSEVARSDAPALEAEAASPLSGNRAEAAKEEEEAEVA